MIEAVAAIILSILLVIIVWYGILSLYMVRQTVKSAGDGSVGGDAGTGGTGGGEMIPDDSGSTGGQAADLIYNHCGQVPYWWAHAGTRVCCGEGRVGVGDGSFCCPTDAKVVAGAETQCEGGCALWSHVGYPRCPGVPEGTWRGK